MNFLELCQDVARETGVSGSQNGDVPVTVANQVGELRRIVGWVQKVWLEIQGNRRFNWMWELAAINISLAANFVAGTIPASRYLEDTARKVGSGSSDGFYLDYVPWDMWRATYSDAYIAAGNGVTAWTVRPDNALVFNGEPSVANGGAVDFLVERFRDPTALVVNTDTPEMPVDLHDLIVYKAIVRYSNFDEAGSLRTTAIAEIARLERDLFDRCLPSFRLGGNLTDL